MLGAFIPAAGALVLQKEAEFDSSGQKILEQTYSNGALVSKSKWDENGKKTAIRYKNKWTKKEISIFDDFMCDRVEEPQCACMRDVVLNEEANSPSIPKGLIKKAEIVEEKVEKECLRRGSKQESNSKDKEGYSYDFGDDYSERDGYEVVHSYDFVEEHLMEIIRVAGNFYYRQGWVPSSIDELINMEKLRLDKAFLDLGDVRLTQTFLLI